MQDTKDEKNPSAEPVETEPEVKESGRGRTGYFAELVNLSEAKLIENEERSIRTTLIKPGWSANGRYYSKPVLKEAAHLFEMGKAYADHPSKTEQKERPERSVKDVIGWYDNVRQEDDGRLTASLHVVRDELWPIIEASVTKNPTLAGLSINAMGYTKMGEAEGRKGVIVEAIKHHSNNSIDIVTIPAAGGKFESLMASDGDGFTRDLLEAMSLSELQETLREVRPDLVKAWQKEWKEPRETEALVSARAEVKTLKAKLVEADKKHRTGDTELKEAQQRADKAERELLVDRLLAGSKLPAEWRAEVKKALLEAKDIEDMKAILLSEAKKAASTPKSIAVRGAGASTSPATRIRVNVRNPIADIFGVDERLMGANSMDEFKQIKETIGA